MKYQLKLMFGGRDVKDATSTVIVGQSIGLACLLVDTNGNDGPVSSYQWVVPGYAVAGYNPTINSATVNSNIVITNASVGFYWVAGGTKQVSCTITVAGKQYSASTTFNVSRPTADFTLTVGGAIGADNNYFLPNLGEWATTPYLHFGNCVSGSEGIAFTFTNANLNGFTSFLYRFFFVQVGITQSRQCLGTNETHCRWSTNGLDTDYPYRDRSSLSGYYINQLYGVASDSPAMQLHQDATEACRGDTFDVYLMFDPGVGGAGTIPVPLKKATWNWSGSAAKTNSSWTLVNPVYPSNVTGSDSLIFPQWTNNIANTPWTTNSSNCLCP
jgi:hypothetical protein